MLLGGVHALCPPPSLSGQRPVPYERQGGQYNPALPCSAHWCSGLSDERGHVHRPGPAGREASLPRLPTAAGRSIRWPPALIHCRNNILYTIKHIEKRLGMSTKQ